MTLSCLRALLNLPIAPFVGLEPTLLRLRDAPTLEMHRARIPNVLFKNIIGDIEIVMDHRWTTRTWKQRPDFLLQ